MSTRAQHPQRAPQRGPAPCRGGIPGSTGCTRSGRPLWWWSSAGWRKSSPPLAGGRKLLDPAERASDLNERWTQLLPHVEQRRQLTPSAACIADSTPCHHTPTIRHSYSKTRVRRFLPRNAMVRDQFERDPMAVRDPITPRDRLGIARKRIRAALREPSPPSFLVRTAIGSAISVLIALKVVLALPDHLRLITKILSPLLWVTVCLSTLRMTRGNLRAILALWATFLAACLLMVDSWLLPHYSNSAGPYPGFIVGFVPPKSWQGLTVDRAEFEISALSDGSRGHGSFSISGRGGAQENTFFIGFGRDVVLKDLNTFRVVRRAEEDFDPTARGVRYTIAPKAYFSIVVALDWDARPAQLGIGRELNAFRVSGAWNGELLMPLGSPPIHVVVRHQHGDPRFEDVQPSPTRQTQQVLEWQWPSIKEPFYAEVVEVNDFARLWVVVCANLLFLGVGFFLGSLNSGSP
jgi:hypothetical protein